MTLPPDHHHRIGVSFQPDSFAALRQELALLGGGSDFTRLDSDFGQLSGELTPPDLAGASRSGRLVYARHLMPITATSPIDGDLTDADLARVLDTAAPAAETVALQVWVTQDSPLHGETLRNRATSHLNDKGIATVRSGCGNLLCVCATRQELFAGATPAALALSDWPGGRVRLARSKQQISRSELKLEEALRHSTQPLDEIGRALDLGASPGGWTRILRTQNVEVVAVDPAELHPSVSADSGVTHVRATAGRFLENAKPAFDLLVCDIRMTPSASVATVLQAGRLLRAGAGLVVTLKTGKRPAVADVHRLIARLANVFTLDAARQLAHNRNEITVIGRRK